MSDETNTPPAAPEYPEAYYEYLVRTIGEEQAAWARLSREEREAELERLHATSNSPDDLALWPPELNGGCSTR